MMAEDGEVLDSWEDQVDSGALDERLKKMSVSKVNCDKSPTTSTAIMIREDSSRTEYKPQVRILKRDPNPNTNGVTSNSPRITKTSKPMKTLEQREAEYAEARMRIFGSADPELDQNASSAVASDPTGLVEKQIRINREEIIMPSNCVLRQPKGPDGTKGFNLPR